MNRDFYLDVYTILWSGNNFQKRSILTSWTPPSYRHVKKFVRLGWFLVAQVKHLSIHLSYFATGPKCVWENTSYIKGWYLACATCVQENTSYIKGWYLACVTCVQNTSYIKPGSRICCNRFETSPRLTISTDRRGRNKAPIGHGEIAEELATNQGPRCDQISLTMRLIWSQTGPGEITD